MTRAPSKKRLSGKDTIIAFRMKTSDHLKVKLIAAHDRRQINDMYRELVLLAIETRSQPLRDMPGGMKHLKAPHAEHPAD